MPAQWEYKAQTYKLTMKGFAYSRIEEDLNDLGQEGWEAFSTLAPSFGSGQSTEITVLLKRASAC